MHKKKLSATHLGWGTSHQTHIGLHGDMLRDWSSEDQIYECYFYIDSKDRCIECQAIINAITSEDGTIRSPKIKTGTGMLDHRNLLRLIRRYATENRRYLTLGQRPDGKIHALLTDSDTGVT